MDSKACIDMFMQGLNPPNPRPVSANDIERVLLQAASTYRLNPQPKHELAEALLKNRDYQALLLLLVALAKTTLAHSHF